jgi:mRNA interferase HigB
MIVRNYEVLQKFARKHARSRSSLGKWHQITLNAKWSKFDDVKKTFGATDIYGDCVIFDIAGNEYRLIAKIDYALEQVSIKKVMKHDEYNRDKWKTDC